MPASSLSNPSAGVAVPYGKRTGVTPVDQLNIVAHDKFQEIVRQANRPDSVIRMQAVVISGSELEKTPWWCRNRNWHSKLGLRPALVTASTAMAG